MRALRDDTRGLSTVEYILILVIVAITALLLWQTFGSSVGSRVDQATQSVTGMEGRGGGGGAVVASGDSAGSATAMAITEGRQGGAEGGGSQMGMGAGGGGGAGGESAGRARPAGAAEGASAGFGDEDGGGGEGAEIMESGTPDLFLWIGWLLVLILGAVTVFSVLGKRIGKGK